ncbi:divalent anion:Na+ symporter (DASS) family transporter [Enterococcus sp. JM4C]|uniref:SLC13 family permease n=1 Tax=Candidatus Enterococcus huntleyi TaxID=1857217 RepID=UPI00137A0CF6|nr:SLC13 family permease [Enterococcus sp. JM4C]KAF1295993.1 divalent anion:Na+ symporter (DASS) family transporter [Enterococcus sp. JM4C]
MKAKKRFLYLLLGPTILVLCDLFLSDILTNPGARAVGVLLWMVFWWVTRPVHMTVTALLPILVNALLNIVPMGSITAQYFSDSIILIFGSGLLTMPWASTGLDKRVAIKILSVIGPSMRSQIIVWLFASMLVSSILPNVAVCALFTPIAIAMLAAAGITDIKSSSHATPILLAIGWGVGLGGVGTPLGGAMNIAAISFIEEYTGHEFMYVDWVVRIAPYFVLLGIISLVLMLVMYGKHSPLDGTKEYFHDAYAKLGKMKRDEKICGTLFVIALLGAFTRPLYSNLLPGLAPAYIFLIFGCLSFIITNAKKLPFLTWENAQEKTMWGMMMLFGGGLALGRMINDSGAGNAIAEIVSQMNMDGGLTTIIIFTVFARVISELTNSTVAAAVSIPIVIGFAVKMGLNPIPYWFITVMAYNAEFLLPISVRAIPVAYGLDTTKMLKGGIPMTIVTTILVVIFGYVVMQIWPGFGELSYM